MVHVFSIVKSGQIINKGYRYLNFNVNYDKCDCDTKPNRRNSKEETLNHGANHTMDDKVLNVKVFY